MKLQVFWISFERRFDFGLLLLLRTIFPPSAVVLNSDRHALFFSPDPFCQTQRCARQLKKFIFVLKNEVYFSVNSVVSIQVRIHAHLFGLFGCFAASLQR